jgi:hypothetical protein
MENEMIRFISRDRAIFDLGRFQVSDIASGDESSALDWHFKSMVDELQAEKEQMRRTIAQMTTMSPPRDVYNKSLDSIGDMIPEVRDFFNAVKMNLAMREGQDPYLRVLTVPIAITLNDFNFEIRRHDLLYKAPNTSLAMAMVATCEVKIPKGQVVPYEITKVIFNEDGTRSEVK